MKMSKHEKRILEDILREILRTLIKREDDYYSTDVDFFYSCDKSDRIMLVKLLSKVE